MFKPKFSITSILKLYEEKKINSLELLQELYKNHKKYPNHNIYISEFFQELIDNKELKDKPVIPLSIKDLYFLRGTKTTAASKMLRDFISPCDAEVAARMKKHNVVFTGKTNMDEFAMGSSGKTSWFGQTLSIINNDQGKMMSPGGSSSGAAMSLLTESCLAAFGSDTGGSIRQPAAWCGLYGYKPTYGIFSRYGIIEMSNSLDTPGYFTSCIEDTQWIFERLIGKSSLDLTTVDYNYDCDSLKKTIGLFIDDQGSDVMNNELERKAKHLESKGYKIKRINIELLKYCINIYYIIVSSEVASNMAKYNGIFYNRGCGDIYYKTRSDGFGDEVKRRILTGNCVSYQISSGNMEGSNLYEHALKMLQKLWEELEVIFKECDCILMPTYDGTGMTIEETNDPDPIKLYKCDLYTCFVNLIGLPGIHIPTNTHNNLPIGVQLVGPAFSDKVLFKISKHLEE